MKVFFLLNHYTAFKNIIQQRKLVETGNISLIKVIKKISDSNNIAIFLLDKNSDIKKKKICHYTIDKINFYSIPFNFSFKNNNHFNLIFSILFLIKKIFLSKQSTFYIDRGNISLAFLIKLFSHHKVILRILGITKQIEKTVENKTFFSFLYRIFWKKKYDLIIHSNDGSNFKKFNDIYLNSKNKELILNQAIKRINHVKNYNDDKFKILLSDNYSSEYKNLNKVLISLKNLEPNLKNEITLYIIYSKDSEKIKIKNKILNFRNIIFVKRTKYVELLKLKIQCDAIITFNSMGYLSNNIVESIFYNNWIITPDYSDIKKNIPKKFIQNFIFINKENLNISLGNKLRKLIFKNQSMKLRFKNVYTNEKKVSKELDLLRDMKLIH
jgi:hypothetical protein|tara:strand:- start:1778 stop:2926 length:1149 start_codon:yes stop_codon:yes gene_type:complete